MANTSAFDANAQDYDDWYATHDDSYQLELQALRPLIPHGYGAEVGVGTGRFAQPFGIQLGIDPSLAMLRLAHRQGINVIQAVAEQLPLADASVDFTLFVTTLCFVDDLQQSLNEAARITKHNGHIIIGFIDRLSPMGQSYEKKKAGSRYYQQARFLSLADIETALQREGFAINRCNQTLLDAPQQQTVLPGSGQGGFVAVQASRI